jgi:hypothetical protein
MLRTKQQLKHFNQEHREIFGCKKFDRANMVKAAISVFEVVKPPKMNEN